MGMTYSVLMSIYKSYQGIDTKLYKVVYYELFITTISFVRHTFMVSSWWTTLITYTVVYVQTPLQPCVSVYISTSWCDMVDPYGSKCSLILVDQHSSLTESCYDLHQLLSSVEYVYDHFMSYGGCVYVFYRLHLTNQERWANSSCRFGFLVKNCLGFMVHMSQCDPDSWCRILPLNLMTLMCVLCVTTHTWC
jgi:hypothetical protein